MGASQSSKSTGGWTASTGLCRASFDVCVGAATAPLSNSCVWVRKMCQQSSSCVSDVLSACAGGEPRVYSQLGYDITPLTMAEWKTAAAKLTNHQRHVALQAGSERSFTGKTVNGYPHDCKADGVYVSSVGELPLFDSKAKFGSGTGGLRSGLRSIHTMS
jgi:SelR domain